MSDHSSSRPGGLDADALPEPTNSLAEFYRAIDGTSRGRKREYYAPDETPGDEHAHTRQPDQDDQADEDDLADVADPPTIGQLIADFEAGYQAAVAEADTDVDVDGDQL